jgi:putative tryptophan/tyrosine transport system substrate-binding protein
MRRREFITLLGGAAVGWPFAARAQQTNRVRRVGVLSSYTQSDPVQQASYLVLKDELQLLGWIENHNLQLEIRTAGPNNEQLQLAAADLVRLNCDVILAFPSVAVRAAILTTKDTPTVFMSVTDPVGQGFVASIAHPGGNVTGFTNFEFTMGPKWIELLKEASPQLSRVAALFNFETTPSGWLAPIKASGSALGLEAFETGVHAEHEIDDVLANLALKPASGLIVLPSPFLLVHGRRIIAQAEKYGLPATYWDSSYARNGGLLSYAYERSGHVRQAAGYVNKILSGVKPADLPVQAPTKYELIINLKTAKALGLTIPPTLLTRADEVIE